MAPAFITYQIAQFIVRHLFHAVDPVVRVLDPWLTTVWATPLVRVGAAALFILAIVVIGRATRWLLFQRLLGVLEQAVAQMPMVGKVYSATRDIARAFGGERKTAFTRVVMLEWPGRGRYVIGFVTREALDAGSSRASDHLLNVFVPHAPNPTSGFLVVVDHDAVIPVDMSVEEGMKLVISVGVVGPPVRRPSAAQDA